MREKQIVMDHGSGGDSSRQLIEGLFLKYLDDPVLGRLQDCAILENQGGRLAFSTDSYVVDPLFFPGGDIGSLAVHGTINDLAMGGARPVALSLGLILEEGVELEIVERTVASVASCAKQSKVPVVTGDTKVVPRGKGDKIYINTSGIGLVPENVMISPDRIEEGDAVIISGAMGDHGLTIMTLQVGIEIGGNLKSDSAPLHTMVAELLDTLPGGSIHCLRDPTRGGVATTLHEMAVASRMVIELDESAIPVHPEVEAGCEILGLDPMYLANEGKCLAVVSGMAAKEVLQVLRRYPWGREAQQIGRVRRGTPGVILETRVGGRRVVTPLHGHPLPRIC